MVPLSSGRAVAIVRQKDGAHTRVNVQTSFSKKVPGRI